MLENMNANYFSLKNLSTYLIVAKQDCSSPLVFTGQLFAIFESVGN